jgi:outer membrane protein OmpA-like peptidoglycan-associated protein
MSPSPRLCAPSAPSVLSARCRLLASSLLAAWLAAVPALAAEPLLKNQEVTESALIDALSVERPAAPDGTLRGFKPAAPGAGAPAKPAGPGRASLLITFQTSSSSLTPESMSALDAVARALQSDALAGLAFRVEGHADARGDTASNMRLSQERAEAVVQYLVDKHGVLPERLLPEGKGSNEPMNTQRVDAPENRRVTIVTIRS